MTAIREWAEDHVLTAVFGGLIFVMALAMLAVWAALTITAPGRAAGRDRPTQIGNQLNIGTMGGIVYSGCSPNGDRIYTYDKDHGGGIAVIEGGCGPRR